MPTNEHDDHQVWFHGCPAKRVPLIREAGLIPPTGVIYPARWFMLTDSFGQAARYAGSRGRVLEFHVPESLCHYRNPGAVLWPSQPHGAYGFPDARGVAVKGALPARYLVADHPATPTDQECRP